MNDTIHKPTEKLLSELMASDDFESYYMGNKQHMNALSLQKYLAVLCESKNITPHELIRSVDIDRVFGHQIFSGRRNPTREYIIKLAFGLGLTVEECQRLLTIAKCNQLYPRVPRDAAFIHCLHSGFGYKHTQDVLFKMGMTIMGEDDRHTK
jgi:hypothetical protein